MRYRGRADRSIPDADALTRHDVARIRGAAAAAVIPGMEGLARVEGIEPMPPAEAPAPARKARKVKRA